MVQESFRALVVEQNADAVNAVFQELPITALPQGDVLISVAYSSLNYKDALAITNQGRSVHAFLIFLVDLGMAALTCLGDITPRWG